MTSPTVAAFGRGDVFALHETAGRLFLERQRLFDGEAGVFVGGGEDLAELLFVNVGGDGGGVVGVEFAQRAADIIGRQLGQDFLAALPGEFGQEFGRQMAADHLRDGARRLQRHVLDHIGDVGRVEIGELAAQRRPS